MPPTARMVRELENSLRGLESARSVAIITTWIEGTADPSPSQSEHTTYFRFAGDEAIHVVLLAYKGYYEARTEIVSTITAPQGDTKTEERHIVGWEVEDIARQFCGSRGLIPDLIACLNEAETIFSNLRSLVAEYDCFHADDYEEEGHIVIRAAVDSDQETALRDYDALNEWMLDNISDDNLDFFVVTVRRTD